MVLAIFALVIGCAILGSLFKVLGSGVNLIAAIARPPVLYILLGVGLLWSAQNFATIQVAYQAANAYYEANKSPPVIPMPTYAVPTPLTVPQVQTQPTPSVDLAPPMVQGAIPAPVGFVTQQVLPNMDLQNMAQQTLDRIANHQSTNLLHEIPVPRPETVYTPPTQINVPTRPSTIAPYQFAGLDPDVPCEEANTVYDTTGKPLGTTCKEGSTYRFLPVSED